MPIATTATIMAALFWSITDKKMAGTRPAVLFFLISLVQAHRHTGTVLNGLINHALINIRLASNSLH